MDSSATPSRIMRVDHEAVEYSHLYSRLQEVAAEVDQDKVHWIRPEDKLIFHSDQDDIRDLSTIITSAQEDWWKESHSDSRHFVFPVPVQPNSTLFFMDWLYNYTGYDLNENGSLLYWQSRLTYFSPIYHLIYPVFLMLISFLTYFLLQGGTMTFWQFVSCSFSQFFEALRGGLTKACSALFRPVMYFYGLYESWKSRHLHHQALTETTESMKAIVAAWKDRFLAVQHFCEHAKKCLPLDRENGYLQTSVFRAFERIETYFTDLLAEYSYLTDESMSSSQLYEHLGKTLVLRWQLTFTSPYRVACSCQAAAQILDKVSSKVGLLRLWSILYRRGCVQSVQWLAGEEEEEEGAEQMVQSRYPFLVAAEGGETVVGNDCLLGASNAIVTGPNATGKTTYIKSVVLNLLLAHHCGVGFFDSCMLQRPFHHFVCYINVPDTSDRDSLFQAEASQALEMIQVAEEAAKDKKRTFAIFDELFTGTNPDDAAKLTRALLRYLSKNKFLRFLCTTHFTGAVEQMQEEEEEAHDCVAMRFVQTEYNTQTGEKTYLLKPGVSRASNVLKVLADLQYPSFIVDQLLTL